MKTGDKAEFDLTVKLWQRVLWAAGTEPCTEALIIHARQSKFAPSPSEILEIVAKKYCPEIYKPAVLAWEEVTKAVQKFGFQRQEEAFATFDEKTKRCIRAVKWWNICYSERPDMVKKEFCSMWDNLSSAEQEQVALDQNKWLVEAEQRHGKLIDLDDMPEV